MFSSKVEIDKPFTYPKYDSKNLKRVRYRKKR